MRVVDRGRIVAEPDVLGGEPHIAGRRIGVSNIAVPIVYQGASPEDIADEFHTHAASSALSRVPPPMPPGSDLQTCAG